MRFPRSKYKATKAAYAGELYDSRAEAAYAAYLDALEKSEQLEVLIRHPRYKLGCPENVYEGDFLVLIGRIIVVDDVKGSETAAFKKNKRLWAKYGKWPLRVMRLKLKYLKTIEGEEPPLPTIKGIDFDVIHGGLDKRVYGPLHPEWLRR